MQLGGSNVASGIGAVSRNVYRVRLILILALKVSFPRDLGKQ